MKKRHSAEQIVAKLHQADLELGKGLKVHKNQTKRGRLWMNDGSFVRLRAERKDHVWSYDFVRARTHDGRSFRMLTLIDQFTREYLAIEVARKLNHDDVLERLAWLMATRGVTDHIRSDNGSEFTAHAVHDWLVQLGVKTLYITQAACERTGTSRGSTGSWRMSCWSVRCSTRCTRRRY